MGLRRWRGLRTVEGVGLILTILAPVAAVAQSANDAHVIRRPRGDVIDFNQDVQTTRRSAYVAPYAGWVYAPVRRGQRLRPAFYAARYFVANPRRLPAARDPDRWVRYGDDLLLVNIRTGRVRRVALGGGRFSL